MVFTVFSVKIRPASCFNVSEFNCEFIERHLSTSSIKNFKIMLLIHSIFIVYAFLIAFSASDSKTKSIISIERLRPIAELMPEFDCISVSICEFKFFRYAVNFRYNNWRSEWLDRRQIRTDIWHIWMSYSKFCWPAHDAIIFHFVNVSHWTCFYWRRTALN